MGSLRILLKPGGFGRNLRLTVKDLSGFWVVLFLLVVYSLVPVLPARAEVRRLEAQSGDVFELRYRQLQPGEPLVLVWKNQVAAYAGIYFGDSSYWLKKDEAKTQLLLLGLDLMAKPGEKNLEIELWAGGQPVEKLSLVLEVVARDFPRRKLTVDQKYVTPPREVLARIKREAELLALVYSTTSPDWLAAGPFMLPCEGKLTPNFGQQRIYNNVPRSVHTGVDIAVPAGHPIQAMNSGRVVLASDLYYSGKTVIIDHGLGLFSSYSHLSKLLVRRGELVRAGQVVGLAGSTGLSTGPHLHWAVRIYEARVDPLALLELGF
ncbi:MAG: M23 family metallopeptidase [Candidatus Saccharicenans sp.]|jgi:murein DD-endopeptidase MepM/ murein hydrolase activator NlpD|nr:M23 family metallopeptidase [Candidatus Saccharicenans sp.]